MSKLAALALAIDKPRRMEILHPGTLQPLTDEKKQPAYIDVFSADSPQAKAAEKAAVNRRLAVRGRTKLRADELEADRIGYLVAVTAGWHLVDFEGKAIDVPFDQETARELYSSPEFEWIKSQVDEFVGDRGNFLKASSKS